MLSVPSTRRLNQKGQPNRFKKDQNPPEIRITVTYGDVGASTQYQAINQFFNSFKNWIKLKF